MFKLMMKTYKVFVLNKIHNFLSCICSRYTVGNISSVTQESSQATMKIKAAYFFRLFVSAYLHRVTSNKTVVPIIIIVRTSNVPQRNKFLFRLYSYLLLAGLQEFNK
jgi:hypothetical protein